jgi:integrase
VASIEERDTTTGRRWDVRWRDHGASRGRTRTFRSREAARTFLRAVELAHDERRPYVDATPAAPRLTLAALATAYLIDRQRVSASAASLEQREIAISAFIGWLAVTLDATPEPVHLTRARLAEYHAWLQTPRRVPTRLVDGREIVRVYQCGVGTANTRVRYVEAWWAWLADEQPEGVIPRPRRLDLATPPAPPQQSAPTWAEMAAAVDCARPSWARLLTVLYYTGVRPGQAMRLRRADVDLKAETLTIRGELGKSRQERAGRTVPISPHLAAAIRTWPIDAEGWLVAWDATSPRYDRPNREADRETARRILHRAGVRPEVWTTRRDDDGTRHNAHPLHCFRAGLASGLAAAGVDERAVKKLLGHSGGVTLDRYTEVELRSVVATIPALVSADGGRVLVMRRRD